MRIILIRENAMILWRPTPSEDDMIPSSSSLSGLDGSAFTFEFALPWTQRQLALKAVIWSVIAAIALAALF